jgi:Tripartite tricarboxylate transporter family receptor
MNEASREEKYRTVATAGAGSISHLIGTKLFNDYAVPMVHVPYQGSAPAILSVAGGHVALAIVPFPDFLPLVGAVRGRVLTKTGDTERRLIAIFAADVEGYSRLMGADEVGTFKDLTQRRDILDSLIASRGGRIANTAGDSVLAEFGSAVDAVQCAVEAQAALSQANLGLSPAVTSTSASAFMSAMS